MNIIQNILTKNDCYKAGRTITVKGLMLHSVGTPQPSSKVFLAQWDKSGVQKCVHAFIDPDHVYQALPWNHRAWHCGSGSQGSGNGTHIGVEMTEPATIKYTGGAAWKDLDVAKTKAHVLATYKNAMELFADLCQKYNLNPIADGVILSHSEAYKRGIASNHGDVEHLWSKFGLSMAQFRKDVKAKMNKYKNPYSAPTKNLYPRDKGEAVKYCQHILKELGHYKMNIDGIYGPGMKAAVGAYQTAKGWTPSYNIGKTTRLGKATAKKTTRGLIDDNKMLENGMSAAEVLKN